MSNFGFFKKSFSSEGEANVLSSSEQKQALASKDITDRLEKFAKEVQKIARKSDDFLYFTIIFLKAAEASLIDDFGNTKKIGNELAWGYFDNDYRWHGNVKPHRNRNLDIFPESELKKAARDWIGCPLCVDHKSDSVDGIRGIILDTYYDQRLKQVVGLCAVDKVNYPDLARKVQTGVVRYGSMGTGVETSVCSECGNKAKNANDYCTHVLQRTAHGEVNVGLKPIEYSLVVQPAEPGAILLKAIASIKSHESELKTFGLRNLDEFTSKLNIKQAQQLENILEKECSNDSCSLEERNKIVKAFLVKEGFINHANMELDTISKATESLAELSRAKDTLSVKEEDVSAAADKLFDIINNVRVPKGETFTSGQSATGGPALVTQDDQGVNDYTGTASTGLISSDSGPITDTFDTDGVGPESYLTRTASLKKTKTEINSILEEIMKETQLRKRAENRRKLAYHFGGAAPAVEPNTFKSEDYMKYWEEDKHMHPNPTNMGGTDGMFPGDKDVKETQKRAQLNRSTSFKKAYHFGGAAPAVEPSTFKSEDYMKYWEEDKHMHPNPTNMGGTDGMFPGDKDVKETQKRAQYNGPRLSTKFKKRFNADGSLNKAASCFEVYAGDKLVIAATARDIMGPDLEKEWEWISSRDYAKAVVAAIREEGLNKIANALVKKAQAQMPPAPATPMAAPSEMPPMDMGMEEMDIGMEEMDMEEASETPKTVIDNALVAMQEKIDEIRGAIEKMGDGAVDVNINVGEEAEGTLPESKVSLSSNLLRDLKLALAEANESADELSKISYSLSRMNKLPASKKNELLKISNAALLDAKELLGESTSLLKVAGLVAKSFKKTSAARSTTATRKKAAAAKVETKKAQVNSGEQELVKAALELRRKKRQQLFKLALEAEAKEHMAHGEDHEMESDAHDGIGMKENAQVAGVTTDMAEDIAHKSPAAHSEHKASPSKGNADAKQHSQYPSTPARQVAEKSVTKVMQHSADDEKMKDVAEDVAEEEVEEHEEKMHQKSDAMDHVKESLAKSLISKKADEERQAYRIKVRRAYDLASEMQRKGMISQTKSALDNQVDLMLEFDDNAFESFKRSVASVKAPQIKTASEGISLNVGVGERENVTPVDSLSAQISKLWDK
jgi:hypothetical protein